MNTPTHEPGCLADGTDDCGHDADECAASFGGSGCCDDCDHCPCVDEVVDVEVIPDPLTDEAARESDHKAWARAVEVEARQLARDRTNALRARHDLWLRGQVACRFACDASAVAILQTFGRSNNADRVQAWDDAADWLMHRRHDAWRLANELGAKRVELFASSLLWSDELRDERLGGFNATSRRIERKAKGARLRALRSIERDARAWLAHFDRLAHGVADAPIRTGEVRAAILWGKATRALAESGGVS